MSAPYAIIRSAFATKLLAFPSVPSIAWENVPFTPVAGQPYLKPTLLPAEPFQAEIGANGQNIHTGIYQISIFYPTGGGVAGLETLKAGLIDHFKRGTLLVYSGIEIRIVKAFPGQMLQETDYIHQPITIQWRAYAPN